MKLSISNLAWNEENEEEILKELKENKYSGIEIAPTLFIGENPYNKKKEAKEKMKKIKDIYGLEIASMQSIWYGKSGNIFIKEDAEKFIEYTKKAIDFASSIECNNLVFGCPKNRNLLDNQKEDDIMYFFNILGDYAKLKNTVIALEANPDIYGTNFINTTKEAFSFVKKLSNKGVKVNIDFGTIIANSESLEEIFNNINLINHIHISEPYLEKIQERKEHKKLFELLKNANYNKYVSIEMKQQNYIQEIKQCIKYVSKIFL